MARKKALQQIVPIKDLIQALNAALSMNIRWVEVSHQEVLRLSLETGLTTYDASYLQVARVLGAPLVTFDQRLAAAAEG